MSRSSESLVLGYHGTTEPSAINIVKERNFTLSENPYDWLGDGAYFFQDAPLRAWLWAKREAKNKGSAPAVVEVEICLDQCLDLLDIRWAHYVRVYHQVMVKSGKQLPAQEPPTLRIKPREDFLIEEMEPTYKEKGVGGRNGLDRVVFNFTVERLRKDHNKIINSVRAAFQEGNPLYETSFLYDRSHIQIAVRDINECLVGDPRLFDTSQLERQRSVINDNVSHKLTEIDREP